MVRPTAARPGHQQPDLVAHFFLKKTKLHSLIGDATKSGRHQPGLTAMSGPGRQWLDLAAHLKKKLLSLMGGTARSNRHLKKKKKVAWPVLTAAGLIHLPLTGPVSPLIRPGQEQSGLCSGQIWLHLKKNSRMAGFGHCRLGSAKCFLKKKF